MAHSESDFDLINSILAGNTANYEKLIKRHERFVFTLALKYTHTREDAEEVAQDTFVKVFKSLATFNFTAKFTTWLYTVTYTTAMSSMRKKRVDTNSIDDELSAMQIAVHNVDEVERKSTYRYLNEAIEKLTADDAAIITLFYKGEQSLEEIGKVLNLPANTVKVKLHRARLRLKDNMHAILGHEIKELI